MALNRKVATVAFDRQSNGKGTAAAIRKYGFGLRSGSPLYVNVDQSFEELTISERFPPSAYRSAFLEGAEFTTRAWPKMAGLLTYAALGSATSSGTASPYTWTVIPSLTLPYLTMWSQLDTEMHRIRDSKVDELEITWNQAEPAELRARVVGGSGLFYQAAGTGIAVDESGDQSFFPAGGTFQIATSGTTPATADITGGRITIMNHLEPIRLSRSLEPDDTWPGMSEIGVELRLIPTDTTLWRTAVMGAAAGTVVSNTPVYGSFNVNFVISSGTTEFALTAPRIAFAGDYPDADPAGGPVELTLTGTVLKAASGASFTATIKNDISGYAGS